jgi:signal transduction histidine kinase
VLDANPAAAEILGVDAGSLRGRSIREVLLDSKTPMGEEEYGRAETHVEDSSGPWVYTFQTSDDRLIESTTEWVDGGEGATAGYIIVLRDHTERRRTERFLRQGQRLESVAALSAGIAHEINNPLAFLRSNLNYIDELARELARDAQERGTGKPQGFDELQSVVAECRDGAERIGGIVDRVRRFSHLQPEELHPVDMHGVIRDAVKLAQLQPSGELTLEMRIESCLPQVQGSHEHLVQALLNLLVNARHAAMTGDEPHVEVTCMRQDHQLLTRVRDSGPGISSHVRGRIFDPFFTTKAPGEGTGLGLPIAYGIAREHGGSLECRSPDDCGAEFCLSLPIAPEDDTP